MKKPSLTPELLAREEDLIERAINKTYIDPTGKSAPQPDGIIDIDEYVKANYRILWILKESHDGPIDSDNRGGWSIKEALRDMPWEMLKNPAYKRPSEIAFGLLNGVYSAENIPRGYRSEALQAAIQKIALINVCKLPGSTKTNNRDVTTAYEQHRELILQQIAAYEPTHIFTCEPQASLLAADLSTAQWKTHNTASTLELENGALLICVYHPSARVAREDYLNDAIEAALKR